MTTIQRPRTEITQTPVRAHLTDMVVGAIGVIAAAVGAWMYYVPTDWFLGGLAEAWYLGFFIGAGVLLAGAFGLYAWKAFEDHRVWSMTVVFTTFLAVAALAGAVVFATILIV